MKPTVLIETHGCKLNTSDSIGMAADFMARGFNVVRDARVPPDVFVLNSCTVTHVADKKARQRVSAVKRRSSNTMIVLTGCYPTRTTGELESLPSVDLVVPNAGKSVIAEEVATRLGRAADPMSDDVAIFNPAAAVGRSRAAVKIQEGCDQVCAYCIVPKVRGRERSVPVDELIRQVNALHQSGCQEVVLTGTQLGHYGFDLPRGSDDDLASMLRRLLAATEIPRVRVSSLQASEIEADLLRLWSDEGSDRLCPHFHIPLQSGSDDVLRRMRRTYTAAQFRDAVRSVREATPECSVTTDVIAGFPGETEADHAKSVEMMEQIGFSDAHIFPYSRRPGTSAHHFGEQIDDATKVRRAAELRGVGSVSARLYRIGQVGAEKTVLWEGRRGETGLTQDYLRVGYRQGINTADDADGTIEVVRLTGVGEDGRLECEPIDQAWVAAQVYASTDQVGNAAILG